MPLMKRTFAVVAASLLLSIFSFATPRTMRVDYYHTGDSHEEWFSLDRVVVEPLEWPGNLNKSIDESQLGDYLFEVRDRASGKLWYSRGFNSVFGEWKTTEEALHANRTFSESLRFPDPDVPVEVSLKERAGERLSDSWKEVWKTVVDPQDKFIDRSRPPSPGPLMELQKMGDPAGKVDLLVLGDGYTAAERQKFEQDARRFMEALFATSPFREHRQDFNVWGLCPAAEESGVSRPSSGIYRRSPVGASYDTFGTERYMLTTENRALRDVASFAPYEFIEILVNGETYGGGGIFNQFATVAIDNPWSGYVGVHEFGHHFAGLADEYYTSDVAYLPPEQKTEPWEPNVTALLDPANLKWRDLVEAGTPLPTPWDKEELRPVRARHSAASAKSCAPRASPRRRWTPSSARSARKKMPCSAAENMPGKSAHSRARITNPRATTVPRWTASCLRATKSFAPSAAAPSSASFACMRTNVGGLTGCGKTVIRGGFG